MSLMIMISGKMDFCLLLLLVNLIESSGSYLLQKTFWKSGYNIMIANEKSVLAVDKIEDVQESFGIY